MDINTDNVGFFAELMNKYGVAIVISAVVIILFIIFIINDRKTLQKSISDPMTKFSNNMVQTMTSLIDTMTNTMSSALQSVFKINSHPDAKESNERDEIDMELKNVLKELLKRTEADRAYVFLYHNGGVSVSGFSFNKMSIISEADAPGIKLITPENQAVQRGPYSELVQALRNHNEYFIPSTDDIKETDTVTCGWMTENASRATYLKAIKDHDRQVIGFFGVDYVAVHDMPTEEKIRLIMAESAVGVSALVLAGNYQKKFNGKETVIK